MESEPAKFKSQVFWIGENKLSHWYSYANRTPQLYGHIMLAREKQGSEDLYHAPEGFENALNLNIDLLLEWSRQYKADGCLPVFFRMNVAGEQFRVHILPVSRQEIQEATGSLIARIPGLAGRQGGFIHYLGKREHLADQLQVSYNDHAGDDEATDRLMREQGITTLVAQLRAITSAKGHKSKLE